MENERIRTCIDTEFEVRGRRATEKIKNMSEGGFGLRLLDESDELRGLLAKL